MRFILLASALTLAGCVFQTNAYAGEQSVKASWYGGKERMRAHTANGERFHPGGLTAAHRSLPFGTRVRVCNHARCTVVRINDRGPAARTGRALDLSRGAARQIGFSGAGRITMRVVP